MKWTQTPDIYYKPKVLFYNIIIFKHLKGPPVNNPAQNIKRGTCTNYITRKIMFIYSLSLLVDEGHKKQRMYFLRISITKRQCTETRYMNINKTVGIINQHHIV